MKIYKFEGDFKCYGCGWHVEKLYVLADSYEEAKYLFEKESISLCAYCLVDLLIEGDYEIVKNE